jgi:hypothetical protein
MRNLISVVFYISILAQLFQPAFSSDISILGHLPSESSNNLILTYGLSGKIQKGDAEKLAKALTVARRFDTTLTLDSPGGDVEEALHIASLVKALHLHTAVGGGAICASACFFIFLAGDHRLALGILATGNASITSPVAGYIGLHRPHLESGLAKEYSSSDAELLQHGIMQKISDYLHNEDVPQRLIDLMMSRPSNDIYWMTQNDIDQLGEYSPSLEELLISRCGYNRNLSLDIVMAKINHDSSAVASAQAREDVFYDCSVDAFPDFIHERVTNIERLRKGWRPWLKSKVAGKRQ